MKDRNYLINMYNATSTADESKVDEIETYEHWLERQLLSRIKRIEELESTDNSKSIDWGSQELIGAVRLRFDQLNDKGLNWKSFYNGWLEGRVEMLAMIRGWKSQ